MPPTSRPTTTMCRRLSIRAFEFGRANAEARRAAAVVLLLARRVLQRHGCGTRLCGEHRHLLAALPLDHGDGRARVLELVVELDAHTRRIRVKGLVHLRRCGAHLLDIGRPGGVDRLEQNLHPGIGGQALRRDWIAVVRLAILGQESARAGAVLLGNVGPRIRHDHDALEELRAERVKRLAGVSGPDEQDHRWLEALLARSLQQQVDVGHVAGDQPDLGIRPLGAKDDVGQVGGARIGVPVQLAVTLRRVARRVRNGRDVRADEQIDLVAGGELIDGGDSLLRIAGVAADELDLAPEHTALRVLFVDGELVAARKLVTVERERTAVRVDRADANRRLRRRDGRERRRHRAKEYGLEQSGMQHLRFLLGLKPVVRSAHAGSKRASATPASRWMTRRSGMSMDSGCDASTTLLMSRGPSASSTTATLYGSRAA